MSTLLALQFSDDAVLPALQQMTGAELDGLPFGVIGFDASGVVRCYNARESRLTGLSPQRVLGLPMFTTVAPCMDNFLVAQRFATAATSGVPLDATNDYVLALRMRPVKVRLRLLSQPGEPLRYMLIERPR